MKMFVARIDRNLNQNQIKGFMIPAPYNVKVFTGYIPCGGNCKKKESITLQKKITTQQQRLNQSHNNYTIDLSDPEFRVLASVQMHNDCHLPLAWMAYLPSASFSFSLLSSIYYVLTLRRNEAATAMSTE